MFSKLGLERTMVDTDLIKVRCCHLQDCIADWSGVDNRLFINAGCKQWTILVPDDCNVDSSLSCWQRVSGHSSNMKLENNLIVRKTRCNSIPILIVFHVFKMIFGIISVYTSKYIYKHYGWHMFLFAQLLFYYSQLVISFTHKISQADHRIYLCTCFYLHSRTCCFSCNKPQPIHPCFHIFHHIFSLL